MFNSNRTLELKKSPGFSMKVEVTFVMPGFLKHLSKVLKTSLLV